MGDEYESVALVKPEVFVYRIPPISGNRGHKAADWSLDNPDWTGRLKLVSIGRRLEIRLEDKATGQLYAKAPIDTYPGVGVEPVSDSSRYFVIRLRNDAGQTASVGMGFADRGDSFDLNDHFKYLEKAAELEQQVTNPGPQLDLGFKEGQTITISLGKKKEGAPAALQRQRPTTSSNSGGFPLLPPPPGPGQQTTRPRGNVPSTTAPAAAPPTSNVNLL